MSTEESNSIVSEVSVSSSSDDLIILKKCYLKIIMHAFRYPHSTVNGLLIMDKKKKSSKSNKLVDCIPLFHSGHGLTPMIEIALSQVSEYLSKHTDLVIGGFYQVNEYFHELPHPTPTIFAERIGEKIFENNPDSVLLMLSNYHLASAVEEADNLMSPFFLFHFLDGKWKLKNNTRGFFLDDMDLTFEAIQELVFKKQFHLNIVDFDAHLENVKYDWRNLKLNEVIEEFIS